MHCSKTILRRSTSSHIYIHGWGIFQRKDIKTMLLAIIRYLHAWRRYGSAVQELSHLSDRDLADIGITRSDIPRVAWHHAHD